MYRQELVQSESAKLVYKCWFTNVKSYACVSAYGVYFFFKTGFL